MIPTINTPEELITYGILGVIGAVFGLRRLMTLFTRETTTRALASGELEIINLMREQVRDIHEANRELRAEIEQLRELNKNLIIENEEFREEIRALKKYIEDYFQESDSE